METNFETLKQEILEKAKSKKACADQYRRASNASGESQLLKVIYDNIDWCIENKVVTNDYLLKFDASLLLDSGLANTGKENTGVGNSGSWNSGDRNSGYRNSGDSNSGERNSGARNSGSWNSGDRNSGYRNSGDWNSGSWNSGDRNSGDSNSGYRNSGAFCTLSDPLMVLFNKPCKSMTVRQWEQSKACHLMYEINPTIWIPWSAMSEEERNANPKLEASEGYCKSIPIKEAWQNAWNNWDEESRNVFRNLENFDAAIFEEITGIKA